MANPKRGGAKRNRTLKPLPARGRARQEAVEEIIDECIEAAKSAAKDNEEKQSVPLTFGAVIYWDPNEGSDSNREIQLAVFCPRPIASGRRRSEEMKRARTLINNAYARAQKGANNAPAGVASLMRGDEYLASIAVYVESAEKKENTAARDKVIVDAAVNKANGN